MMIKCSVKEIATSPLEKGGKWCKVMGRMKEITARDSHDKDVSPNDVIKITTRTSRRGDVLENFFQLFRRQHKKMGKEFALHHFHPTTSINTRINQFTITFLIE
jgi:hypothetical protein